ncbi:MAG: hypothetical protein ACLQVI_04450 [Polyangiaceae bacterium]|jgi:hypothetical protein
MGASSTAEFAGPDRRRHRVYVTRNTEYHFRDGFCVAVRDRRTGDFLHGHLALRRRIHGGLKFYLNGAIVPNPGEPQVGEALYFASDGRDLVTSPLEAVERPSKELAEAYAAPAKKTA